MKPCRKPWTCTWPIICYLDGAGPGGAGIPLPRSPLVPANFRAGGYLAAVPQDRGALLFIRTLRSGRCRPGISLHTLGADGAPGGEGVNADVSTEHLKYLDQIDPDAPALSPGGCHHWQCYVWPLQPGILLRQGFTTGTENPGKP